jgi:outer membrane murein-binding lipoprotein Lpp
MRLLVKCTFFAACFGVLAGCQSSSSAYDIGSDPVSIEEAVSFLDRTCGASRPDFAGAGTKMQQAGLTNVSTNTRVSPPRTVYTSPTQEIFGSVFTGKDGLKTCWITASYPGDLAALQAALEQRYGAQRPADVAYFGTVRLTQFDRGRLGKMLLRFPQVSRTATKTLYSVGLAGKG